jgi:hypothetical protein
MKRLPRLIRLAALPTLLVLLAVGSLLFASVIQTSLEAYRSPYLFPDLKPGPATARLVDRVVVVVVDGLRLDTSHQLPELMALRAAGADFTSLVGLPSYSRPGYTVLGTGAWQDVHGFLLNWTTGRSPVDSLFAEAQAQGLTTALVGYSWWDDLFGDHLTYRWTNLASDDPARDQFGNLNNSGPVDREVIFAQEAIRMLRDDRPDLLYVHFQDTDQKAHDFGVGKQYLDEALVIDGQIERLARELDLSRSVLVVTADHGHIRRGGHGGWEPDVVHTPLILVGQGIRPGRYGTVQQVDIPTTVAALLGVPFPTSTQGRVLWEALDVPLDAKAAKVVALAQTQAAFARHYIAVLGGPVPDTSGVDQAATLQAAGEQQAAFDQATAARDGLAQAMATAHAARLTRERLIRLPVLLLVLAIPVLAWWRRLVPDPRVAVPAAAAFFVVFHGLFLVQGNSYSLSTIHTAGSFIQTVLIDAVLAALISGLVAGVMLRRVAPERRTFEALAAVGGVAWTVLVQAAAAFVWSGGVVAWTVPNLLVSFWLFLCLFQLAGLGLLSPVLVVVALRGARLRG